MRDGAGRLDPHEFSSRTRFDGGGSPSAAAGRGPRHVQPRDRIRRRCGPPRPGAAARRSSRWPTRRGSARPLRRRRPSAAARCAMSSVRHAEIRGPLAIDHHPQLGLVELQRRVGIHDAAELLRARAQPLGVVARAPSDPGPRIEKSISKLPPPMLNDGTLRTDDAQVAGTCAACGGPPASRRAAL